MQELITGIEEITYHGTNHQQNTDKIKEPNDHMGLNLYN